jgi:hypothetical protein
MSTNDFCFTKLQSPDVDDLPALDTTVFEDIIDLFESIMNDMLKNIVNYVFTDVQARSQPYRRDKYVCNSCVRFF